MNTVQAIKLGRTDMPEQKIPAISFIIAHVDGLDQNKVVNDLTEAAGLKTWEIPESVQDSFKKIRIPQNWIQSDDKIHEMYMFCQADFDKLRELLGYASVAAGGD